MKYTVSFTAWYLNPERICQLINSSVLAKELTTLTGAAGRAHVLSNVGIAQGIFVRKLEEWLHSNTIPSLAELLLKRHESDRGALFTIYQDFYGRGLSRYSHITGPLPRDAVAELHNKLKYADDKRLRIIYSPKNLISSTAWSRLRGNTRLFCFCYLEDESDSEILARPYLIGDLHDSLELETPELWSARQYGEVHLTEIDQFRKVEAVYKSEARAPKLEPLRKIPEVQIKRAIAEIIHEDVVPKDWGGSGLTCFRAMSQLKVAISLLPSC